MPTESHNDNSNKSTKADVFATEYDALCLAGIENLENVS